MLLVGCGFEVVRVREKGSLGYYSIPPSIYSVYMGPCPEFIHWKVQEPYKRKVSKSHQIHLRI